MKKISHWIEKLIEMPVWKSMIILFVVSFAIKFVLGIIIGAVYPELDTENTPDFTKSTGHIVIATCIGPLLETFIFQMLPVWIVNRFITKNIWIQILPSAILFGCAHTYFLAYVIAMIFLGVILALGFCIYQRKFNYKKAFWYIALLHASHNIVALYLASQV